MAAPAPGVLQKLLDGMKTGAPKPIGEHRTAVLQVTDIVPAELDERDLWPRHGKFYVKVSDSSQSVYAALPPDQGDLVLSNRLQLGQFVQVERLEPGSPVPVLRGAKLIPGRHPLMGTPEPVVKVRGGTHKSETGSSITSSAVQGTASRFGGGGDGGGRSSAAPRRGSWDTEPVSLSLAVKGTILDFEDTATSTPVRGAAASCFTPSSPAMSRRRSGRDGSGSKAGLMRASAGGALLSKAAADSGAKAEGGASLLRQSCAVMLGSSSKFQRSKSNTGREFRIPRSPFHHALENTNNGSTTPPPRVRPGATNTTTTPVSSVKEKLKSFFSGLHSSPQQPSPTTKATTPKNSSDTGGGINRLTLPGKLGAIGKDVMQQREEAQRIALQALRDASAAETLVRVLRMFSDLCSSARADTPATCFEQFLNFHQETLQAISDMEKIQAAATVSATIKGQNKEEEEHTPVLHEIQQNNGNTNPAKRRTTTTAAASKAISFLTDPNELQKAILGRHHQSRSSSKLSDKKGTAAANEEVKTQQSGSSCTFANSIRTMKQIQTEAGNWFMEFLEAALESGLKKSRTSIASTTTITPKKDQKQQKGGVGTAAGCPQSLMLKVINWMEMEQCDNNKKPLLHPRAAQIARKLRIKVKNP